MASTYLSRAGGTPTSTRKFTISFWVKKSNIGGDEFLVSTFSDSNNRMNVDFNSSNYITFICKVSGSIVIRKRPSRLLRDTNAWYHIVIAVDTTQSTAADRCKFYINGVQETAFSIDTNPSQNADLNVSGDHFIGAYDNDGSPANFFGGLLSHVHYTDGYTYAASTFGETDSTTGEWKINTNPSVTYGTNGYFIMKDNGSVTDQSGQSNNFTLGAGTLTSLQDCPSNVFATWNVIMNNAEDGIWSNGNTTIAPNGDATYLYAPTTIGVSSGKWYSEHMITGGNGYGMLGAISEDNITDGFRQQTGLGTLSNSFGFRCRDGAIRMASSNTTYGSAPGTSSAILGMALDMDNKKVWYHVNGTYVTYGGGVGNPGSGTYGFDFSSLSGDTFFITCGDDTASGYGNFKSNFGNGIFGTATVSSAGTNASNIGVFEYDVPTGFTALSTKGLNL
jgi:hypothetical protein